MYRVLEAILFMLRYIFTF